MKVKDFKCKCGHDDFFFADKGNQKGIYCSYCGKWFKWADKDEQNLAMKQEPILDKVKQAREKIDEMSRYTSVTGATQYKQLNRDDVLEILDELIESER